MRRKKKEEEEKAAASSPFDGWTETAAVRAKPSPADVELTGQADELAGVRWFVTGATDELLSQPALQHLGMRERNGLYAARLVRFLDDTALTEHRIVNVAAQVIAENRLRAYVPEPLALDALKLYTDEGYHAWFTARACQAIRAVFAIPACDGEPSAKIAGLEALAAQAPPAWRDLTWFMIGFVAETMVTKAIVDVMRNSAQSAIQRMLLVHLEDEWVHAKYFAQLFRLIWPGLDADARRHFGQLLPRIMAAFHVHDEPFLRRILAHAGLDAAACDKAIARLAGDPARHAARLRAACGNTLQVLQGCGVFGESGAREAFIRAGLLERGAPVEPAQSWRKR